MSAAEDWDATSYEPAEYAYSPSYTDRQKPEQWYRENSAVFHALEEWQRNWDDHARDYQSTHGRPPSSMNREKNKAAFRRKLIEIYGRGEPDAQWVSERISFLEKRGQSTSQERFSR